MVNQDVMLPPADTCVVCEKHLSEIGGYRLTAGGSKGIFICHKADMTKRLGDGVLSLNCNAALELRYFGDDKFWTKDVLKRAVIQAESGKYPWFCQCCGGYACKDCGAPLFYPPGTDVIHDDGKHLHCAIFPVPRKCINAECDNYKVPG
ncbi:hypothetical protein J3L11_04130 [Shewanella sp. 4t3-1-2LB]|uniref:hypothetical protein n=1 Tax=Shewanella sp. 4t3-1-2LB TaxID=2817682 RepID=UPI001A9A0DD9|nr:hypothetical protein [Shewanella sp. 4t3-1-2LB]MBO1270837.1 hypothetical protein [Shewanella sp. 4t3-1-2LB]